MTVIRLNTEEALVKRTGIPHIRSGYWLLQSKQKESRRHSQYYVFCIDNIESDKPQSQPKYIYFIYIKHSAMQWFKCTFQTLYVENSMPKMTVLSMGPS